MATPAGYRHMLITIDDIQFYVNVLLETTMPTPGAIMEQCTHIHTVHYLHCFIISWETVRLEQQTHRQSQQRPGTTQDPPTVGEDPVDGLLLLPQAVGRGGQSDVEEACPAGLHHSGFSCGNHQPKIFFEIPNVSADLH